MKCISCENWKLEIWNFEYKFRLFKNKVENVFDIFELNIMKIFGKVVCMNKKVCERIFCGNIFLNFIC